MLSDSHHLEVGARQCVVQAPGAPARQVIRRAIERLAQQRPDAPVRDADRDEALRRHERPDLPKERGRIGDVLEHLERRHEVERHGSDTTGILVEGQRVDVGEPESPPGHLELPVAQIDPRDVVTVGARRRDEIAGAASDVE